MCAILEARESPPPSPKKIRKVGIRELALIFFVLVILGFYKVGPYVLFIQIFNLKEDSVSCTQ